MNDSATEETITLDLHPSLIDHVRERLRLKRSQRDTQPEELISPLMTAILDNSSYPISATRTGTGRICIRYRLRSFSEPIL